MVAPALSKVAGDLGITQEVESQLVLSIFVLAYSVGPLILGPLSEEYGRVPVLQLSNLFFLAWNLGCGFAKTKGQMLAFRFLSGLGGSAPLAIGGGILSDCFRPDERGKSIAIYSVAPLLGPAVGEPPTLLHPVEISLIRMLRSCRWWVHRRNSIMALGILVCLYCGRSYSDQRSFLSSRNLCAKVAS